MEERKRKERERRRPASRVTRATDEPRRHFLSILDEETGNQRRIRGKASTVGC